MRRQGLLSTGEFARLCHTTKETLYHYAELGLLRPAMWGQMTTVTMTCSST